ncbi:MAG: DUF1638 domain-containing protein [Paracoccaceae bacterium]
MTNISDSDLTTGGLSPTGENGRILIIACGAPAREILALTKSNQWSHMDLTCLPAILHNHPEKICDAVAAAIAKHRQNYQQIYVAYADCGTGGHLLDLCKKLGVEMVEGPHCYSFYEGNEDFAIRTEEEIDAFFLTDFLVRQFDAFVWKPLGLDRHPELRDAYFGNYRKLIYQAQTDNPDLDELAQKCAEKLGLDYERKFTGYGDLETTLATWATSTD